MKTKNLIIISLIITCLYACGQNNLAKQDEQLDASTTKSYIDPIAKFIPDAYSLLDSASGDLNLDEYKDLIIILKKNNEEQSSDVIDNPERRPLLILTGQGDGKYKLAAKSNSTVYCYDCGGMMGDPYEGITIKNGYFSVEHYGGSAWRWSRIITYKFSKTDNHWFLHRDGGESFHASKPEQSKSNMRTVEHFGKVKFENFDIYEKSE